MDSWSLYDGRCCNSFSSATRRDLNPGSMLVPPVIIMFSASVFLTSMGD